MIMKQLLAFFLFLALMVRLNAQQDALVFQKAPLRVAENNSSGISGLPIANELPPKLAGALLVAYYATGFHKNHHEQSFLPVILAQFSIKARSNGVTVSWNTDEEYHLDNYVIEYSSNGKEFINMGIINASGNHYYEMLHANPFNGANFYRVRINSRDGRVAYTKTGMVMVQ
jgi:hypothetical protein